MARNSASFQVATLAVIVGLAIVVYGEEAGPEAVVVAGGIVVLIGLGILTNAVSQLEAP